MSFRRIIRGRSLRRNELEQSAQDISSSINTAVAALAGSAPAALDTIAELAAALNDDENFATTVTNSLASKATITQTVDNKTANYTLTADDRGKLITCNGTFTITIPSGVFSAGDRIDFVNIGTGVITLTGSGVTVNSADDAVTIDTQWAGATVFFTSSTTAVLIGNIA